MNSKARADINKTNPLSVPCLHCRAALQRHARGIKRRLPSRSIPEASEAVQIAANAPALIADTSLAQQGTYIGLGLALVSFLLTFGVAPRFKSSFKEPETWKDIYNELTSSMGGVQSIKAEDIAARVQNGAVLMDVRMPGRFESGAMPCSQSFPLYQPISGWGLVPNIRRAAFAFFGIYGSERNYQWLPQVEGALSKGAEIIVACEQGGSLTPKNGAETGFQSQSLKAAYYLRKAGFSNVLHLEGGVAQYTREVAELVPGSEAAPPPAQAPTQGYIPAK